MAAIVADRETALAKFKEIQEFDNILAAATGSSEAGKRAIANSISSETEASWSKAVNSFAASLEKIDDPRVLVGSYTALLKTVKDRFGETVEKFLESEVEARKGDTPSVSPEQLAKAQEERKEAVNQYNALKQLLEMFGEDISELPNPRRMSGPRGKQGPRGKRLPKNMQLAVNGKDRSATQNTLSSIAHTLLKDVEGFGTKELRQLVVESGFDFENPTNFEVTLPGDKGVLTGYLTEDVADEDEDEDEDETEESVEE